MSLLRVVLDTNVVVSGLRSRRGASFALLSEIGRGRFEIGISVPLVLEYDEVLYRNQAATGLSSEDIDAVLDYLCSKSHWAKVFYLWRPFLPDPGDDMVLEAAVAGGCEFIVTHNLRDFRNTEKFGVRALTPADFSGGSEVYHEHSEREVTGVFSSTTERAGEAGGRFDKPTHQLRRGRETGRLDGGGVPRRAGAPRQAERFRGGSREGC